MEIKRYYEETLINQIQPGKVLAILGARRVGKTSLLQKLIAQLNEPYIFLNGDDFETANLLEPRSIANYSRLLNDKKVLIIDEAQEIPEIGRKLKLMVDTLEGLKVIITGSSAFEINNQIGEPLTGRMKTRFLFPIAQIEFNNHESYIETRGILEDRLVFGSYPEVSTIPNYNWKIEYLKELINNHLLRDIFAFEGVKKRDKITSLLQKIAFRTGSEISAEALGREIGISKNTAEKYLDLFSKVYIMYSMSGFSRNRDNEITKMKKWFFVDNGIRNALINSFNKLSLRNDVGQLWENYINSERRKRNEYKRIHTLEYFWRTHSKQEIDRIEEYNREIAGYEYKWGDKPAKIPSEFASAYPRATFQTITPDNYLEFII